MADQVETRAVAGGQPRPLGFEFLDVVFAEIAQTKAVSFVDHGGRELLRYRDQGDIRPLPAGAGDSFRDSGFNLF